MPMFKDWRLMAAEAVFVHHCGEATFESRIIDGWAGSPDVTGSTARNGFGTPLDHG